MAQGNGKARHKNEILYCLVTHIAMLLAGNSLSTSMQPRKSVEAPTCITAGEPAFPMFHKKPHLEIHDHERRKAENAVMRKQYETLKSPDSLVRRWMNLASEFLKSSPPKPKAE